MTNNQDFNLMDKIVLNCEWPTTSNQIEVFADIETAKHITFLAKEKSNELQEMVDAQINNHIYDFYYSAEHEHLLKEILFDDYVKTSINGKVFTEAVKIGETPFTDCYEDLVFICTDDIRNVTVE